MKHHSNSVTQQWDTHKDRHHSGGPEYPKTHGQQWLVWLNKIQCVSVITPACENLFCCWLDLSLSALRVIIYLTADISGWFLCSAWEKLCTKVLWAKILKTCWRFQWTLLLQWQLLLYSTRVPKLPVMILDVWHRRNHFFGKRRLKNISSNKQFCVVAEQQNIIPSHVRKCSWSMLWLLPECVIIQKPALSKKILLDEDFSELPTFFLTTTSC